MPTLDILPISPVLGAEVRLGNLRTASDHVIAELKEAIHTHQVVFLRGQELSADDLLAVATQFGEPVLGATSIAHGDQPVRTFEITLDRPPRADMWHTDLTFYECPPAFGFLHNLVAPAAGGDTIWASSYAAYESLSPALQLWCDELTAAHDPGEGVRSYLEKYYGIEDATLRIEEAFPSREQPLVIRHPHTGRRALFMTGNFLHHIVGLHPAENDALLALLRAPYDNPNFQTRWRWSPGDLAIWDQRAANHRGLSDHYPTHPSRTMQTIFVGDGIPVDSLAVRTHATSGA